MSNIALPFSLALYCSCILNSANLASTLANSSGLISRSAGFFGLYEGIRILARYKHENYQWKETCENLPRPDAVFATLMPTAFTGIGAVLEQSVARMAIPTDTLARGFISAFRPRQGNG